MYCRASRALKNELGFLVFTFIRILSMRLLVKYMH